MIHELATAIERAAQKEGMQFLFEQAAASNVEADAIQGATCELRAVASGQYDVDGGIYTAAVDVLLMCYDVMPFDFTGWDAAELVDSMNAKAIRIIAEISTAFSFEREMRFTTLYDNYDVNVGGVAVEFRIKGLPQCLG